MRLCGVVCHQQSSVRKANAKNHEFEYWTDMFMCSGQQVGGYFKCRLSTTEVAKLTEVAKEFGRDYGAIQEHAPEICEKLKQAAYEALEYSMAKEVYGDYDFSGPEFKGWKKERKIRYIMETAEPVTSFISIGFEIPEDFCSMSKG